MPVNRNAQLRYNVIDQCLSNRGRRWTWRDIRKEVNKALKEDNPHSTGIGKTTFFSDLKDIEYRIYKMDIERITEGRQVFLRYAQANNSIKHQALNENEVNQLKSALQLLLRFKGMPQFEWINELIPAIESRLGFKTHGKQIISFEINEDYEGLMHLTPLFNAIVNERVLRITYQDFKSPLPYDVTFHPYYLKQYNSRWYILGYNPILNYTSQPLALDRIQSITEISDTYIPSAINWEDYFSDFVGITRLKKEPIEIKILITDPEQAAYIRTKPLHQTQKSIRQVNAGFETSIKVIPNYELEKLLLSFGERIKVVAPKEFRSIIKNRVGKLYELYDVED